MQDTKELEEFVKNALTDFLDVLKCQQEPRRLEFSKGSERFHITIDIKEYLNEQA